MLIIDNEFLISSVVVFFSFWQDTYKAIGKFDVLLDDGGHQSFQQIITLVEALRHASEKCIIVIEDTHTSFMNDFNAHGDFSFLNYAKSSTDLLTAKGHSMYPERMRETKNSEALDLFKNVHSIQFFNRLVAYKINNGMAFIPETKWNHKNTQRPSDFRYEGSASAKVLWPNPFLIEKKEVLGGKI